MLRRDRPKRFLVVPGRVRSWTDGDDHHITSLQLMRLYGVDPRECVVAPRSEVRRLRLEEELVVLRPDPTGAYEIPKNAGIALLPLLVLILVAAVALFWAFASAVAGLVAGWEVCMQAAGGFWECVARGGTP